MHTNDPSSPGARNIQIVLWILAVLALLYLIIEHPAHLLGWVAFLIVMACPLMHLFRHGRHGHGAAGPNRSQDSNS